MKSRRGSGLIAAAAVFFAILVLASVFLEYSRLQSTERDVRDAVQAAVTETCEEQYANLYDGVREGYSGGYRKAGRNWSESLSPADVYARLDTSLGTRKDGSAHVKYAGTDVNYRLSGLSAQITNAPFAPGGKNTGQLACTAEIDLQMPLMVRLGNITPLHGRITVESGYIPKF